MKNKEKYQQIVSNPLFFERNRVFRVYEGGKLFGDFFGDAPEDGNYPEEWVVSQVKALNKNTKHAKEGVSRIKGTDIYLDELIEQCRYEMIGDRQDLGVLVKVLDSAIRLPIQSHPDKAFSQKHFHSNYGKAEMWIILKTRQDAKLYFGFKDRISKEEFAHKIEQSIEDKTIMVDILNEIEPKPGEAYFVPAKMVHAIGYGCLILEIQEPTDFTIQPEAWCGNYRLDDYEMYLGLNQDTALECFDYELWGSQVVELALKKPLLVSDKDGTRVEKIIDKSQTPCFSVNRISILDGTYSVQNAPGVYIVTQGEGMLAHGRNERSIKKGDYFFIPHILSNQCQLASKVGVEVIECLPPEA